MPAFVTYVVCDSCLKVRRSASGDLMVICYITLCRVLA